VTFTYWSQVHYSGAWIEGIIDDHMTAYSRVDHCVNLAIGRNSQCASANLVCSLYSSPQVLDAELGIGWIKDKKARGHSITNASI